jgi:hypothetical protein
MIIFSRWTNLRKSAHFSGISVARIAGIDRPSLHDDETALYSAVSSPLKYAAFRRWCGLVGWIDPDRANDGAVIVFAG